MLTLENISNRLLVIPKPARVSALRAELTSLNHKLPAEVGSLPSQNLSGCLLSSVDLHAIVVYIIR